MEKPYLPVVQKSYELYKTLHIYQAKIPKHERYTLWQKIENLNLEIISTLFSLNGLSPIDKLPGLLDTSTKLDLLKLFMRLAYEIKIIDHKKYLFFQTFLAEIGKMLGGWIKSTKALQPPNK